VKDILIQFVDRGGNREFTRDVRRIFICVNTLFRFRKYLQLGLKISETNDVLQCNRTVLNRL
jgi:hypothetical protein